MVFHEAANRLHLQTLKDALPTVKVEGSSVLAPPSEGWRCSACSHVTSTEKEFSRHQYAHGEEKVNPVRCWFQRLSVSLPLFEVDFNPQMPFFAQPASAKGSVRRSENLANSPKSLTAPGPTTDSNEEAELASAPNTANWPNSGTAIASQPSTELLIARAMAPRNSARSAQVVGPATSKADQTPWLRITKLPSLFSGQDLGVISKLGRIDTEGQLESSMGTGRARKLVRAVTHLVQRCVDRYKGIPQADDDPDVMFVDVSRRPFDALLRSSQPNEPAKRRFLVTEAGQSRYTTTARQTTLFLVSSHQHSDSRYHFHLTSQQSHLLDRVKEYLDSAQVDDDKPLQLAILDLWHSLILQELPADLLKCPLLRLAGFLCVNNVGNVFLPPGRCGSLLAGLQWIARLFWVSKELSLGEGLEWECLERRLVDRRAQVLVDGRPHPMAEVMRQLAFAKKAGSHEQGIARFTWDARREVLTIRGTDRIQRAELVGFVHHLHDRLQSHHEELALGASLDKLELDQAADNLAWEGRAYSFVNAEENINRLGWTDSSIIRHILSTDSLRASYWEQDSDLQDGGQWNAKLVRSWLTKYARANQTLALVLLVTGGQCPRGEELVNLRFCNDTAGPRSFFVYWDQVSLRHVCGQWFGQLAILWSCDLRLMAAGSQIFYATNYNKSQYLTGNQMVLPRGLPKITSQIVAQHLLYMRATAETFHAALYGKTLSSLLFTTAEGDQLKSQSIGQALGEESLMGLGCRLTAMDWRHLMVNIANEFLRPRLLELGYGSAVSTGVYDTMSGAARDVASKEESDEDDMESGPRTDDVFHLAASHREATGKRLYGLAVGQLHQLSTATLEPFLYVHCVIWPIRHFIMTGLNLKIGSFTGWLAPRHTNSSN